MTVEWEWPDTPPFFTVLASYALSIVTVQTAPSMVAAFHDKACCNPKTFDMLLLWYLYGCIGVDIVAMAMQSCLDAIRRYLFLICLLE